MDTLMGISEIDARYLSTKRSLLSNPGTKLDGIYYTKENTTVELAEVSWVSGRFNANLSSLDFGSGSQVVIPNQSLLSTCYLHLELPPLPVNVCLPRGWGYAIIQSISYLFGSSNVAQLSLTGPSMLQVLLGQTETSEKFSEMLRLGGEEASGPTDPNRNLVADVILPFPWSSANGLDTKLPLDTTILANPVTINIQFGPSQSIYGGLVNTNNRFAAASVYLRQGDMSNQSQSMRSVMAANPQVLYSYPFIHAQGTSVAFDGILEPTSPYTSISNNSVTVNLLGFLNSDLVGVSFVVIQQSYLGNNGISPPRPLNYELPKNLQVFLNGVNVYTSPKQMQKTYNLYSQIGKSSFSNSQFWDNQTVSPFLSDPVDTYITFIDFSRVRSYSFDKEYQNVRRIGNNTLVLTFNTATTNRYMLFATYHYNAIAEMQGGESRIYMD